jgi:hypothetical protein
MLADESQGARILQIIRAAGSVGITKGQITRALQVEGCKGDCENWIETYLEGGEIEVCGKFEGATLYRCVVK